MRTIGTSPLRIHPLCLGANPFGWTADRVATEAILDAFLEGGGNFVDTADSYSSWVPGNRGGESETFIGAWMAARKNRSKLVIATKVGGHPEFQGLSPKVIAAAADASLSRLRADVIDLYYAHHDDGVTPIEEISAAFDGLVRAGKVRAVGISNLSAERIEGWLRVARAEGHALPVALQPAYSLVDRANFERNLAPIASREGLSVFPYPALASGFLTGKYRKAGDAQGAARGGSVARFFTPEGFGVLDALDEVAAAHRSTPTSVALAWLLAKPTIGAPIASVSRKEQLAALLAAPGLALTAEELARLDRASASFA